MVLRMDELTGRDRKVLAFEQQRFRHPAAKESAIVELFDMSPTAYHQVLAGLLDSPAAYAADPMLIKRLRRLRASRRADRGGRLPVA